MDVEHILRTLNGHGVEYILIGGTFAGEGSPLTCDAGILISDTIANRTELNFALEELGCECKIAEDKSKPVPHDPQWLETQPDFQLTCPHGALDLYRSIKGIDDGYDACRTRAVIHSMPCGEMYYSLGDADTAKL